MAKKKEASASPFVPVEEQPYPIPENWCWTYFGYIASLIGGGTPSKTNPEYWNGSIPWASIKDMKGNRLTGTIDTITEEGMNNSSTNLCPKGSLILATRIEPGKTILADINTAINQDLKIVVSNLDSLFLHFYFVYSKPVLERKSSGSTVLGITTENVLNTAFPLPPLPEQKRIVTRIESLFAKLDVAREKAQAVVDGFELRKSAILHKAFTGELTERWRKEHGVGLESWAIVKLIDVLTEKPRNGYSPKPVNYSTPYKSMTLSATTSGVFKEEHFKYIDETIPDNSYLWLKPGDILIQRANSLDKVGTSAIYTGREHEFIYPDLMMKLQVVETTSPQFVAYSLKRDEVLSYFRENATGTAGNMPKINQKTVSQTPLNLPTFDEQTEIVRILESLFAKIQQSKEAAEAVLDRIDTMKKAILARAFCGELGTNDAAEEWAGELVKTILER